MQLSELLDPARIDCQAHAASKKRVVEILSELLIADTGYPVTPHAVFDCLIARERLGSTGLGFGVALPHGRMAQVPKPVGAFLRCEQGVDFDSPDGQSVDLIFGLLVPEDSTDEHLEILSQLAGLFNFESLRGKLRAASSVDTVFDLLSGVTDTA